MKRFCLYFLLFCLVFLVVIPSQAQLDSLFTECSIVLKTETGAIFGTLTTPTNNPSKMPIVLFIAGSGPTDRNGNSIIGIKTNTTLQLAHVLAQNGIASVRYDKRGIGESSAAGKSEIKLRFDNYVQDAKDWVTLLRRDARYSSLVVVGHSEGSLIGMISSGNADKFISIAGAGEPAGVILKKQLKQLPVDQYAEAQKSIDTLQMGDTLRHKTSHYNLVSLFRPSVQPYLISWFKYDPKVEIKKLSIPVLILQGKLDLQVSESDAQSLHDAQPKSKLVLIDNMNHVLKDVTDDKSENAKAYTNPYLPVDTTLVKSVIEFIRQ